MGSTWFKSVRALKTDISFYNGTYTETQYVLIAETADSNLRNFNGGHDYHEWIYASGNYLNVMRQVCRYSVDFDSGIAKWKPNAKDSCGFIRMCKKALDDAKEATTIPNSILGIIFYGDNDNRVFRSIIDLYKDKANVVVKKMYGNDVLTSQDLKTYILISRDVENMKDDYKNNFFRHNACPSFFNEWIEEKKEWYKTLKGE